MKIQFIKSPIGAFNMAYFAGDTVDVPDGQGQMLVDAEYAVKVDEIEENATIKNIENPEKKKRK